MSGTHRVGEQEERRTAIGGDFADPRNALDILAIRAHSVGAQTSTHGEEEERLEPKCDASNPRDRHVDEESPDWPNEE